jgi:hypothetical protein
MGVEVAVAGRGSKPDLNPTIIERRVEPAVRHGVIARDIGDPAENGVPGPVEKCHAICIRAVHVRFDLHFGPW